MEICAPIRAASTPQRPGARHSASSTRRPATSYPRRTRRVVLSILWAALPAFFLEPSVREGEARGHLGSHVHDEGRALEREAPSIGIDWRRPAVAVASLDECQAWMRLDGRAQREAGEDVLVRERALATELIRGGREGRIPQLTQPRARKQLGDQRARDHVQGPTSKWERSPHSTLRLVHRVHLAPTARGVLLMVDRPVRRRMPAVLFHGAPKQAWLGARRGRTHARFACASVRGNTFQVEVHVVIALANQARSRPVL